MSTEGLRHAMAAAGLHYSGPIIADGKLRRIKVEGDKERNSWYVLHHGQPMAGAFGCWKRGTNESWCERNGHQFSDHEWREIKARWAEADAERKREESEARSRARETAQWIYSRSKTLGAHEYLTRKDVQGHGELREYRGLIVLPLRDAHGTLQTLQFIGADGAKRFLRGGQTSGASYTLSQSADGPLYLCEGYATGATIFEATGHAVICAMNSGNLLPIAKSLRELHPEREIVIAADDDHRTKGNPGVRAATEAAKEIKAKLAVPHFDGGQAGTDFNDLCAVRGISAVREQLRAAKAVEVTKTLIEIIEERRFNPLIEPPIIRPVFTLQGKPISTPGNITTINAQVKAGKSAVIGAMLAAPMAIEGADTLGFASKNPEGRAMVHIDTEQSKEDHWYLVHRAMRRAGVAQLPKWLMSYCFTGFDAPKALEAFFAALKMAADQCGGLHSVELDGVADLVRDVNDPEECNAFVARLHATAIEYSCPIAGVIHQNPGTEKTRGHLGSQLERKAETNLRLEKDGETTELFSEKQRRAPILKGTGPRFRWSDDHSMHVSVESGQSAKDSARIETLTFERDEVFGNRPSMRYNEIISTAISALRVSERTAGRRFDDWRKFGLIEKSIANLWTKRDLQ